jgi:hypothetical protein
MLNKIYKIIAIIKNNPIILIKLLLTTIFCSMVIIEKINPLIKINPTQIVV